MASRPRKVISHKIEKVELKTAEQPWIRLGGREPYTSDSPDAATEELLRKFQGILNKLTPQKFKNLAEHARDLEIDTKERLKGCVDKIFSNALKGPMYCEVYAHLCRVLSFIKVDAVMVDENGDSITRETTFRRELLTRCQKEFEKDKRDDEKREELLKAIEEATLEEKKAKEVKLEEWENNSRKRALGFIKFLGQLFKLKMLSESIMHECIVRLLRSTSDNEALQCFTVLIATTGKELDHPQAKQRMDRYFERINEIIEKKRISSKTRFMLQDIQDLRKNDWVPRRQPEKPRTIDEIHQEAEMKAIEEKMMIQAHLEKQSSQDKKIYGLSH